MGKIPLVGFVDRELEPSRVPCDHRSAHRADNKRGLGYLAPLDFVAVRM